MRPPHFAHLDDFDFGLFCDWHQFFADDANRSEICHPKWLARRRKPDVQALYDACKERGYVDADGKVAADGPRQLGTRLERENPNVWRASLDDVKAMADADRARIMAAIAKASLSGLVEKKRPDPSGETVKLTPEEHAIAILAADPTAKKKNIAARVGVDVRTLGRWEKFARAWKAATAKDSRRGIENGD